MNQIRIAGAISLTSDGWADQIGDGVEEEDHAQRQGQRRSSNHIRCHHGDQGHIGAVKVTIEHSEGH